MMKNASPIITNQTVIIPNTVTKIDDQAFEGRTDVTKIIIPDSVTATGEYNQEIEGETNVEIIPVSA